MAIDVSQSTLPFPVNLRDPLEHIDPTTGHRILGDPSEYSNFAAALSRVATPIDPRTDELLAKIGIEDTDPVMREQALFELASRQGADALATLKKAFLEVPDTMVRQNLLWAIQKIGTPDAQETIIEAKSDLDPDVSEWAAIFAEEMNSLEGKVTFTDIPRTAQSVPGKLFDETLFLHISCDLYIRLNEGGTAWGKMRLSPLGLARIFGQAYACPMIATRDQQIVIAKDLKGLHSDGSDYYESFLFRGFTERTESTVGNFYFESNGPRAFFLSGKAEDFSQGVIKDVPVGFMRMGTWFLDENLPLNGDLAIRYVRGSFQGWGYVNLQRISEAGVDPIQPGNALLSTLHHPEVGPLTNTFITGSFKGRLRDTDGDGVLEFNPFDIHATLAGEVDTDLDGVPDVPNVTQSSRAYQS
ncbi:MAG: HEAT repeat domain-containing protein [Candidatus Poribacteria bacterium]|nr:HEAT repeat domain-containing protein [Candidatus Poribacteria bacterium]